MDLVTSPWGEEVVDSVLKVSSRDYIVSISTRRLVQDERGRKETSINRLQNMIMKIMLYCHNVQ